jgi:RimJ/RimL family protein N-acetyltransferase
MACPVIVTERLFLREWRNADVDPFAAMNSDPRVMQYFPETYSEERTRRFVARIGECWAERGYGLWAVERQDTGRFIGYVGLWPATFPAHFTPALDEIVSFTSGLNVRSWRVMERLGMRRDASGDFEHPNVPEGHPVRPHVLYRIRGETRA